MIEFKGRIVTSTNRVLACNPCDLGWLKLTGQDTERGYWVGDDVPLTFQSIIKSNGLSDALWALRTIDDHPDTTVFAEMAKSAYELQLRLIAGEQIEKFRSQPRELHDIAREYESTLNADDENKNLTIAYYMCYIVHWINLVVKSKYRDSSKEELTNILCKFASEV